MKNSQNLNHDSTQLIEPKLELTNIKLGSRRSSNTIIYLLTQHPLLLLSGFFMMILGTSALAFYSLSHVGGAKQSESESIPVVVEEPITTTSENSNPTPLWMVMAIALSCGSGCYVIFRLFNRSTQPHKVPKPVRSNQKALKSVPKPKWEPQTSQNLPVFVPLQALQPIASMAMKSKSLVEVLPPPHQYRLDKGKESLADLMDIRKDNSLSTLLQK
ncbi:hypothetical protein IQ259_24680 [Fortiea sp. LEGE XX443]|uniref:hypothetical protein n=1 Tax=Fortiea sp. LEGE XX443 TaxID=1828611 RepID=UPI00187E32A4|nr:hypothetical protein [Fortiea sp. LEGE XX443]MBE9008169.1 hypothetical protein [Fortiea sp. LEGE XX443]